MTVKIRADLHVHTCLSPCGDNSMIPKNIIEKAVKKGINMIAICDHNTCGNVSSVMEYAADKNITVIPGMEATSREEVHTIALFRELKDAKSMESFISEKLAGENDDEILGYQLYVDKNGEIIDADKRFLLGAPDISLESIVEKIKSLGGIAISSHIDREAYGIIGQLGFIPEGLNIDAIEFSPRMTRNQALKKFSSLKNYPFVTFSDAHFPDDIGSVYTEFELIGNDFNSLKNYFDKIKTH